MKKLVTTAVVAVFMLTAATAEAKPAKFYSATVNTWNTCTGVQGTAGGTFGAARPRETGTFTSDVTIQLRGVAPNTTYDLQVFNSFGCGGPQSLGQLTTNSRGSGSGSYSYSSVSSGFFTARGVSAAATEYSTENTTF